MPRLPRLRGREVIAALRRAGFGILRVKGSHHFLRHSDGRRTVVPWHSGETIGPGLLNKILRDTEMTAEEFSGLQGAGARALQAHRRRLTGAHSSVQFPQ